MVIAGEEAFAGLGTMTRTEATAGTTSGVLSLFTSSTEKIWTPGGTLAQVNEVALTETKVPGAVVACAPGAVGGTASI